MGAAGELWSSGFADYAGVRFLPDPAYEGQSENDVDWNAVPCASDQWVALLELLSAHTRTANECYFCLWEGWPFPQSVLQRPKLTIPDRARVPYRAYFLFRGPLSDACDWGTAGRASSIRARVRLAGRPRLVRRQRRDPHWAGIGADAPLIQQVVADPRLDAVAAHPTQDQPAYQ